MVSKHEFRQKFAFVPQQLVTPSLQTELSTPFTKKKTHQNIPQKKKKKIKNQTTTK